MKELVTRNELCELAMRMDTKYKVFLKDRKFTINFGQKGTVVDVQTSLASADESYVYPVEANLDFAQEEMEPRKAVLFLIDYIDNYFEDFFAEGEVVYLPIAWKAMSYDGIDFQLQGQILNKRAERWADEILAKGERYDGPDVVRF